MKKIGGLLTGFALVCVFMALMPNFDFLKAQKAHPRVQSAYAEKAPMLKKKLKQAGLSLDNLNILIVAYKHEQVMEVFAKGLNEKQYKKLTAYPICAISGTLGPKNMQGDNQVPEGFYHIDKYNPASSYYLSLGLDYPNEADKRRSNTTKLGGDIFIHGACVTIGCMPMTNDKIKEIYLLAIEAHKNGQEKIPVYVFPFRLTQANITTFAAQYEVGKSLMDFWMNLKTGYDAFQTKREVLEVKVDWSGKYTF